MQAVDVPSLLARFSAEALLVDAGLEEGAARRHAGFLARLHRVRPRDRLVDVLGAVDLATCDPRSLHAHALLLAKLAIASPSRPILAQLLSAWSRLGEHGPYLEGLASIAEVPSSRRAAAIADVPVLAVRWVAALAASSRDSTPFQVLRDAGAKETPLGRAARAAVDALRRDALTRFEARVHELEGLDVSLESEIAVFEDARETDARLDGDPEFRRRVVTAFLPRAWRPYTARRWDDLRALLRPLERIAEGLAAELEASPSDLSYRSSVAQLFVFRAEMAPTLPAQIVLSERALALCPTLRNARVVLAAHLVHRAELSRTRDPSAADADIERALELDPFQRRALALRR